MESNVEDALENEEEGDIVIGVEVGLVVEEVEDVGLDISFEGKKEVVVVFPNTLELVGFGY